MSRSKLGLLGCLAAALVFSSAGPALSQGREAARNEIRGLVKTVAKGAITIAIPEGRENVVEKTFALAKDVEVVVGAVAANIGRGGLFKEAKLDDLTEGVRVSLTLAADMKTVDSIVAEGTSVRGTVKAVDAKKNTITIVQPMGREAAGEEKTYTVAPQADIAVDDGRGRRFSIREAKLGDLTAGSLVNAWLSLDKTQVQGVLAEGPSFFGTIKTVDADKKTVTVEVRPARGDDAAEEKVVPISPEATVLVDDGKGRRLSLKEIKLANIPVGAAAALKMAPDQHFAMMLRVEGPTLVGRLKSVDADKGILVLAIPKGRDEVDEKSLPVAKDARVNIDGADSKLANLKAGDDSQIVMLRLSLDQRTVMAVVTRQQARRE